MYIMHVIEYQHRGLPHAHIVIQLTVTTSTEADKIAFIDSYINARFPDAVVSETDQTYSRLIREHMVHKCSEACLKADKQTCKRGYTEREISDTTTFDHRGFPLYKRPQVADLLVVPHNREILLDWQGHSNVEFCG